MVVRVRLLMVLIFGLSLGSSVSAREVFVSITGKDSNDGSKEAPYRSLQKAISGLGPGDICTIRRGRYKSVIKLRGLRGTAEQPITIRAYPGEPVFLDGTMPITSKWMRFKGNVWKTKLKRDIWQLFADGRSMTLARWPNSKYWTEDFWDQEKSWAQSEDVKNGYKDGHMVDSDLKSINVPLKGCVAVINSDRWRSRAGTVTRHVPGSDTFEFTKVKHFRERGSHYYFLTGLYLLNAEDEWFYDKHRKTLYFYSKRDPGERKMRGRVTDAILVHERTRRRAKNQEPAAEHIVLDGLVFYGGRVNLTDLKGLTIRNSYFYYTVASKRTLGSVNDALYNNFGRCEDLKLINNVFRYCDGKSLVANHSANGVIENCLFYMVDFACLAGGSNSYTVQMEAAPNLVYRRNEIKYAGASEGMRISGPPDAPVLTEYNYHTHCGLMQTDGASIQYPPGGNINSVNRYNWFIDVGRTGLRFDGNPGGEWGIVYRCVSALGGHCGFKFKGDNQEIYHNLGMDNERGRDICILSKKGPRRYDGKANLHSRAWNNAVQANDLQKTTIINPKDKNPNWDGPNSKGDLRNELRDPDNLDFRPRKSSELIDKGVVIDSVRWKEGGEKILDNGVKKKMDINTGYNGSAPDLGVYEYGDKNYFIPGRILNRASHPIPPNDSQSAKADADLMWLTGRDARSHKIYLGESEDSLTLKAEQKNNIYVPDDNWAPGKKYYWRVDSVTPRGVVKGDVWSFKSL